MSDMEPNTLRELDRSFASWVTSNFCLPEASEDEKDKIERLAKAVSYALHLKHTCLDLDVYAGLNDSLLDELVAGIDGHNVLNSSGKALDSINSSKGTTPLVRSEDGKQIWLQKYFNFERGVSSKIKQMGVDGTSVLSEALASDLDQLYPDEKYQDQKEAVKTALTHRFSVITGGPGTGKTYTAARIIALMAKHGIDGNPEPRIALAAPTGKAANRVYQSLKAALDLPEVKSLIDGHAVPQEATTLHSLLKIYRGSPKARQDAANPLPVDVLIIDEASMIDLPMMHRVLDALPDGARLILLGDKDQLSSVEAGSVLGEVCAQDKPYIAIIKKSKRYEDHPEIGELAEAINRCTPGEEPSLPDFTKNQYVTRHELTAGENTWEPAWLNEVKGRLDELSARIKPGENVSKILSHQTDFQILCALRKGPFGVEGINSMVERRLKKPRNGWYSGCPVMILSNDHQRKLYNGDVGLVLPVCEGEQEDEWLIDESNKKSRLMACFPMGGDKVKAISFAQMPSFETCYAMTVHKSQGSEYTRVLLVFPDDQVAVTNNPVITKELVYTGVTRAKENVEIWCGKGVLESAVKKQTVRMSGLSKH